MRILKNSIISFPKLFIMKSKKNIVFETIDFTFKPNHYFNVIVAKPTKFKISNVNYKEQYESRDF